MAIDYGRVCYEAWIKARMDIDGVEIVGTWDAFPESIQDTWRRAAQAVLDAAKSPPTPPTGGLAAYVDTTNPDVRAWLTQSGIVQIATDPRHEVGDGR